MRTNHTAFRSPRLLRYALPLLAMLLAGSSGCKEGPSAAEVDLEQTLHPDKIQGVDPNANRVKPGLGTPLGYNRTIISMRGPVIAPTPVKPQQEDPINDEREQKSYTDIADIYWKLNWMRKELLRGSVPYNMLDEIEKARKHLLTVTSDKNYPLAKEALDRMEKGLEHLACLQTMHAAQIDDLHIPWGTGVQGVQQYFDRISNAAETSMIPIQSQHTGDTDDEEDNATHSPALSRPLEATSGEPTPTHRQALALVLNYETCYHEAPRMLMQHEWETAIRVTNHLRDNLDMQNRESNKDGDGTYVEQAVSMAVGDYGTIHVPADAGKGGVAPAEVDASHL